MTNYFQVYFEDACLTTQFVWPAFGLLNINLYTTSTPSIPLATTVTPGCQPVSYTVNDVVPTIGSGDVTVPDVTIDDNGGDPVVVVTPTDPDNVGEFDVVIEACTTIQMTLEQNCQEGDGLVLGVNDPCLNTQIVTSDITTVMAQPIFGYDELNLYVELQGQQWPWTDTVDVSVSDTIGTQMCGPLIYSI